MGKEVFIPNWYIDRKKAVKSKKIKVVLSILILLNVLISIYILNISSKIRGISKEISHQKNNPKDTSINNEPIKHQVRNIEKYKEITDYFEKNNLNFNNLSMNEGKFELDIEVKNHEEYIDVIKCIEKHYSIKYLTLLNKSKKEYIFKVIL
jgi:cell division protein FtsL